MSLKTFKIIFYIILILLILLFYTKDLNLFGDKFYKNIKEIKNPNKLDVLVNKNNKLDKFYKPNDLIKLNTEYSKINKFLRKEAAISFELLSENARQDGYYIIVSSAYRSYFYQNELYNYYIKEYGKKYADKCSAKPGHSEHQTGLAIDVMGSNNDYNLFEETEEFKWMIKNSYKYGFILRYPKGKENITGFKYEPWHYRYVGKEVAKYIHENNITLEEYKNMKH